MIADPLLLIIALAYIAQRDRCSVQTVFTTCPTKEGDAAKYAFQMLVSEGIVGEKLSTAETGQGDIPMDYVVEVGAQVAERFPAYETAGIASSWTGVYDVTPDWNLVLGTLPGIEGLVVGYGFSGHGFKLSPTVGRVLAQAALGLPTDVSLKPYSIERFETGALLTGKYGLGAVS
ncbi:FAD dependent oxidoreductase [Paraburkholderia unamae]|nr:FAD dependent oxidoreductase [Paraburkholderia unamae]